ELPRYFWFAICAGSQKTVGLGAGFPEAILTSSAVLRQLCSTADDTVVSGTLPGSGIVVEACLTNYEEGSTFASLRKKANMPEKVLGVGLDELRRRMKEIQEAAKESGLSLQEIGLRMGLDPEKTNPKSMVSYLVNNAEDPGFLRLAKFCEVVEVPMTSLVFP